jgi:hypothetical protein
MTPRTIGVPFGASRAAVVAAGDGAALLLASATGESAVKTSASSAAKRPMLANPARLCIVYGPFLEMATAGAPKKPPPPREVRRRVRRDSP